MKSCVLVFLFLALVGSSMGKKRNEGCFATIECEDPALMCSGAKCLCLSEMGFSVESSKIWACNSAADCQKINDISVHGMTPEQAHAAHAPVCVTSSSCPPIPGFTGYCDVALIA